jgi:cell division protein FtsB
MTRRKVPADTSEDGARPSGLRRAGRVLGVVGGSAALFGVLAVAVFPTSTFLDQRASTAEAEERLAVLRAQNRAYEERIERLQTASEIVRLAREQYNLVFPGEEAYAVLPAPLPELDLPAVWPFGPLLEPDTAE